MIPRIPGPATILRYAICLFSSTFIYGYIESHEIIAGVNWTPEGRLLFSQGTSIQVMNADGTGARELHSSQQISFAPVSCGHGRFVVFSTAASRKLESISLWRMNPDGSNTKQLAETKDAEDAICAADSKWVFYADLYAGPALMRVSIDGGTPQKFSNLVIGDFPSISPDGKNNRGYYAGRKKWKPACAYRC